MEKKFKNVNKLIMTTVAILLTLVLVSTSLVSGIFAKYVVTKDATTVVSLKKFGVKLQLLKGEDFTTSGAQISSGATNDDNTASLTATVTVQLVPSATIYDEIIKFVVSKDGTPSVTTNIKVKAEVTELSGNSYNSNFYVPAEFYVNKTAVNVAFSSNANNETLKTNLLGSINGGIKTALSLNADASATNGFFTKQIATANSTSNLTVSSISFGVSCPFTSSVADADKMITQLAEQEATVKIKYTVSLEQAS